MSKTLRDHAIEVACAITGASKIDESRTQREDVVTMATPPGFLKPTDVFVGGTQAALYPSRPGFAADIAAPVVLTRQKGGSLFGAATSSDLTQVASALVADDARPPRVNLRTNKVSFSSKSYAIEVSVPREVMANSDVDLNRALGIVAKQAIDMAREIRVAALLQASTNWATANVVTVASGAKWNGTSGMNPVADVYSVLNASSLRPTHILMSRLVSQFWFDNADVQRFIQTGGDDVLPEIVVIDTKQTVSGAISSIWGDDVVLVRSSADPAELTTARSARWSQEQLEGAPERGEQWVISEGVLVRAWGNQVEGPRGLRAVTVCIDEDNVFVDNTIGGVIKGAYQ